MRCHEPIDAYAKSAEIKSVLTYLKTNENLPFEDLKDKLIWLFRALFLNSNLKPLKRIEKSDNLHEYFIYIESIELTNLVEIYKSIDRLSLISLIYFLLRLKTPNPGLSKLCISLLIDPACDMDHIYRVLLQNYLSDSKNSESLDPLVTYDSSIFCSFMCYIITSSDFNSGSSESNLNEKFEVFLRLIQKHSDFFDQSMIYYIVSLLQERIMDRLETTGSCESKAFYVLLTLGTLLDSLFERGFERDLVVESNIDGLLQLGVLYQTIPLPSYLLNLQAKSLEFTKNALLSLDNLLCNDLEDINIPNEFELTQIYNCLKVFQSLITFDALESHSFSSFGSLILKIFSLIQIPDSVQTQMCQSIERLYSKKYFLCCDHLTILKQMLSYSSFTSCPQLRQYPLKALFAMSFNYDNEISNLLDINRDNYPGLFTEVRKIVERNNENPALILRDIYLIFPILDDFNYNKLIYEFYKFENIYKIRDFITALNSYPERLLKSFKKTTISDDCNNWPNNSFIRHFHKFFESKLSIDDYKKIKNDLTPIYPDSSPLETRLYLFILSINPQKKKELDSVNDALFLNVFKYYETDDESGSDFEDNSDICQYIREIVDTYKIPGPIIDSIIERLCQRQPDNLNLMTFAKNSTELLSKVYNSKNKFKIMRNSLLYKNIDLFDLFITIQTRSTTYVTTTTDSSSNWCFELFKLLENPYFDWDSQDKYSFWESISQVGIKGKYKSSEGVIEGLNLFFKAIKNVEDYIYVDRRMTFKLSKKEVNDLDDNAFNSLITEKVKNFNDRKLDIRDLKKSNKGGSNKKRRNNNGNNDQDEILKSKDIEVDSGETLHVSITVYPNGKREAHSPSEDDPSQMKRLTRDERKSLFLDEVKTSKIIANKNKCKIRKYSDYILKPIINDIFKCVFNGSDKFTGRFIGKIFGGPRTNFSIAEDTKIKSVLEMFKIEDNKFTNLLYIKFVNYLLNRKIVSPILKRKLKQVENLDAYSSRIEQ